MKRLVLFGALGGVAYAVLNNAMDYWHNHGAVARLFVTLHEVVDDLIPVAVGALIGLALHYRHRIASQEKSRAEALRERLRHVERDQAVWVVAAATLHELKNPLHSLGLLLEDLEASLPANDLADRMRRQMDRALVPLSSLRDIARRQRGTRSTEAASVVVDKVVRDLSHVARANGVDLTVEGRIPPTARVDADYLRIILENLIGNSLESVARGGHVHLSLDRSTITVSDDGAGLGDAASNGLFRPLETAKDGGLGLGLSIARALARAMGGDLVTEPPGARWSTSFKVALPSQA